MKLDSLISALKHLLFQQVPKLAITEAIFWLIAMKIDNPALVDVCWVVNHFIIGASIGTNNFSDPSLLFRGTKTALNFTLLALWTLRLGGYLLTTRIIKPYVDPRYKDLAAKYKINKLGYFFIQFQFQGILSALTGIPLYYLFTDTSQEFTWTNYLGISLALTGLIGEAIADHQLYQFKQKRKDNKESFRGGLFKKSRHPNLFFELVFWSGMAVNAIDINNIGGTIYGLLGPFLLWGIMNFVTIPVTTAHMKKTKTDFNQYIQETNKFWPF